MKIAPADFDRAIAILRDARHCTRAPTAFELGSLHSITLAYLLKADLDPDLVFDLRELLEDLHHD